MHASDKIKIRWTQRGALIQDGTADQRYEGDEDIVEYGEVRGLVNSGKVEIIEEDPDIPEIGEGTNVAIR